jgi:hypothetical protein
MAMRAAHDGAARLVVVDCYPRERIGNESNVGHGSIACLLNTLLKRWLSFEKARASTAA